MQSLLNPAPIHPDSAIPYFSLDFPVDQSSTCTLDPLASLPLSSNSSSSYSPSPPYSASNSAAAGAAAATNSLNNGWTTLHLAVEQDRLPVVSMLLAQRADVFAQDFCGATPLHIAAAHGNAAATSLLLEAAGKNDNADEASAQAIKSGVAALRDLSGATPLHLAAAGGHEAAVAALLGLQRATQKLWSSSSTTSSSLSTGSPSPSSLSAFPGEDAQPSTAADRKPSPPLSNPNAVDTSGQTPLHLAALAGCEPIVQMLLDAGADIRFKAANGWTALHLAGCAGHERIVALLLRHGAEVDCRVEV